MISSSQTTAFMQDEVDHIPVKFGLRANRKLNYNRLGPEPILTIISTRRKEIGADLVHLVDEDQIRGTPYLSAWRHTVSDWGSTPWPRRVKDGHRSRRARASDRSTSIGEVDVPRGIDDVDALVFPYARRRRRRNRDAALLLLLHPVHDVAVPSCTSPILWLLAGVVQHALGRRGLAGVNVRHDADIAVVFEGA